MNIGILGSGDVAQSLARGFLERGDAVMLGTRDPAKLSEWKTENGDRARVGSFAETAKFGELIALATLGEATEAVLTQAGVSNFAGKVVIDATNPLEFPKDAPPRLFGFDDSLGERVQRAIPQARVVKAFNIVGNPLFVHPHLPGGPPTMLIAGNDESAKQEVLALLGAWGWEGADLGGIEASRYLEAMCIVWVLYGIKRGSRNHAFKVLTG